MKRIKSTESSPLIYSQERTSDMRWKERYKTTSQGIDNSSTNKQFKMRKLLLNLLTTKHKCNKDFSIPKEEWLSNSKCLDLLNNLISKWEINQSTNTSSSRHSMLHNTKVTSKLKEHKEFLSNNSINNFSKLFLLNIINSNKPIRSKDLLPHLKSK